MVESRMAEEDQFGRPLQFRPSWPPRTEEKPMPNYKPGFSLAFSKSNWPPPGYNEEESNESGSAGESAVSGSNLNNPAQAANSNPNARAPAQGLPSQNNTSEIVKPKKQVRDYSGFYAKNAAPPSRKVYVVQPGSVQLPEAFTASNDESEFI